MGQITGVLFVFHSLYCAALKKDFCTSYFWQYGNIYTLFSKLSKIKLIKRLISLDIMVNPQSGTSHVQSDIMYCFPHFLLNVLFYEVKMSKSTCYRIPANWYVFTVARKYFLGYLSFILLQATLAPLGIPSSILLIALAYLLKRAWRRWEVWAECDTLLGKGAMIPLLKFIIINSLFSWNKHCSYQASLLLLAGVSIILMTYNKNITKTCSMFFLSTHLNI